MVFSNPINIATAAMEDIFERLCWLYSTMRFTTVCDGSGNHHSLSDLTELSKGKIPYPEQFANKMDYEQNTSFEIFIRRTSFARGVIGSAWAGILPLLLINGT